MWNSLASLVCLVWKKMNVFELQWCSEVKGDADMTFLALCDNEMLIQQDVVRWILRSSGWKSNEGSFLWVLLIFQRMIYHQFKAVKLPQCWKWETVMWSSIDHSQILKVMITRLNASAFVALTSGALEHHL